MTNIISRSVQNITHALFALFFVAVPLAFFVSNKIQFPNVISVQLFDAAKEAVARILTLSLFVLFWIQAIFFKKPVHKSPLYLPLAALLLYQGASLWWSLNPHQGFDAWIHGLALCLFFFVAYNLIEDRAHIRTLMKLSLFPAALTCLISVACHLLHKDLPFFHDRIFKQAATFGNYKFAAEYVTPLIFWGIGLALTEKNRFEKYLYASFSILTLGSLIWVYKSRASMVGLGISLGLLGMEWTGQRLPLRWRRPLTYGFAGGMGIAGLAVLLLMYFQGGSSVQRIIIWKTTAKLIADHPWIGVGLGNFNLYHPFYSTPQDRMALPVESYWNHFVRQAHNEYLQGIAELGLVGALIILILAVIVVGSVRRYPRQPLDPIPVCLGLSLICALGIAFFVFNLQNAASSFLAVASLAFLMRGMGPKNPPWICQHRWIQGALLGVILTTAIFLPRLLLRQSITYYHQLRANALHQVNDLRALTAYQDALKWHPNNWEVHFLIGKAFGDHLMFSQGTTHFRKSLSLNPYNVATLYNLGIFLEKEKKMDEASDLYQTLLLLAPDFRMANMRLGHLALNQNKFKEAEHYFKKVFLPAAYQQSEMFNAHHALAICYQKQGNSERMEKEILEAFLLNPTLAENTFLSR